ncbi:MAG TPA: two-component regulator propeller domain-containing protein, partial [bacterium]
FTNYVRNHENPYSLSQNSIQVIYKDAKGDLWIGTRGGINFLNMDVQPFMHFRAGAGNSGYLNNQVVYSICEDSRGDLWFGTEEGGVNHLNRSTGTYEYYTFDKSCPEGITSNNIKHIVEDREGGLWIATYSGGVNRLDPKTKRFEHYRHDPKNPFSLWRDNVQFLFIDQEGDLWVGSERNGLDLFDRTYKRFIHVLQGKKTQDLTTCQTIMQDRQGRLWMGFGQSTIGCYDKKTRQFRAFSLKMGRSLNFDVGCILENAENNLWIGIIGGGLLLVDKQGNVLKSFSKQNGLPSNVVYGILEDGRGRLWLSTANGLCRFNPATGQWKTFYKENGLQSNQFCYNAYMRSHDGNMFFGGINGVTMFHPDSVRENAYIPPVVVTNFKVFNKPVGIGGKNPILNETVCETKTVTLAYSQSVFTFEFSGLNFANSRQNQYAYRMEGFEKDWNYVNDRRFATYTNLKPAKYVFHVKAANNDGLWNEVGRSIQVTVLPPFWQKWWFKALAAVMVLFVVRLAVNYQIQKRNVLKAMALANVAQLKLLRNQMNPHFLFNAHNSIRSMILIDKERAWQMVTELSEFLRYTLLNFNKIEAKLGEEISAVNNYLHIEKIRYRDSLDVTFHVEDAAKECMIPAFSLQPVVENAIKYGMQTSPMPLRIDIAIRRLKNRLTIDVSNTGKLLRSASKALETDDGHGKSIENIKTRLALLFRNRYAFHLIEKEGWVHVKISMPSDRSLNEQWTAQEETALGERLLRSK